MSAARKFRIVGIVSLASLLVACPTPPRETSPPATQVEGATRSTTLAGTGDLYRIVPDSSLLTILVYRGGALARAGHNHVVASHNLTGTARVGSNVRESAFELRIPVESLTVDEPQLRSQEGPEFPPEVPQSAKEGTRANMLGKALLDAQSYPEILVRSEDIAQTSDGLRAKVQVFVRDQPRTLEVPLRYEVRGSELMASGELPLKQTDLGLTPFTALMGALQVRDEMQVKFKVIAHRAAGS
jgi:polyisoprenoid-binding protein YceI